MFNICERLISRFQQNELYLQIKVDGILSEPNSGNN